MTKTRRRQWWSIGDKSSVCEINFFCSLRLKFHSQYFYRFMFEVLVKTKLILVLFTKICSSQLWTI
jgi:hypothetical protein